MTNKQWRRKLDAVIWEHFRNYVDLYYPEVSKEQTKRLRSLRKAINNLVAELIGEDDTYDWSHLLSTSEARNELRSELLKVIGKSSKEDK